MFERLDIPDLILVKPAIHRDARGCFHESYRRDGWQAGGVSAEFVQDNHSFSEQAGVIRGLHFQSPPHAQAKLVRCSRGRMLDVAVDIRQGSPTFGRHVAIELSSANGWQLYIPAGFAHGFCTLEPACEVQYKCSSYYAPEHDRGLAFDDPELNISWPVKPEAAILSDKDRNQPRLSQLTSPFSYPS